MCMGCRWCAQRGRRGDGEAQGRPDGAAKPCPTARPAARDRVNLPPPQEERRVILAAIIGQTLSLLHRSVAVVVVSTHTHIKTWPSSLPLAQSSFSSQHSHLHLRHPADNSAHPPHVHAAGGVLARHPDLARLRDRCASARGLTARMHTVAACHHLTRHARASASSITSLRHVSRGDEMADFRVKHHNLHPDSSLNPGTPTGAVAGGTAGIAEPGQHDEMMRLKKSPRDGVFICGMDLTGMRVVKPISSSAPGSWLATSLMGT